MDEPSIIHQLTSPISWWSVTDCAPLAADFLVVNWQILVLKASICSNIICQARRQARDKDRRMDKNADNRAGGEEGKKASRVDLYQ